MGDRDLTAFNQQFLFLRNPAGGVEDLAAMKAAGYQGVFCNVRDYPVSRWEQTIRPRALAEGMFCGPWGRTAKGPNDSQWDVGVLDMLVQTAQAWGSPLVVNAETEIDHSGASYTSLIADALEGLDGAVSVLARPLASVQWTPLANIPVLPQVGKDGLMPASQADLIAWRDEWWAYGVNCVFWTLGTYGGSKPSDYALQAPYSLYTADDCGGNYAAWSARSTGYVGCKPAPAPEPDWWTVPYPKGTKKAYAGDLPYPLYPPDAAAQGKTPTPDCPLTLAIKRAVIRGQRWDTPLGQEDDSYSNSFSHGKGGNVKQTGVAGVQRQQKIDPTGWLGKATFDALNWALVPAGPNKGQPLFDAKAVSYIKQAAQEGPPKPPAPPPAPEPPSPVPTLADFRAACVQFADQGLRKPGLWNYTQSRPVKVTVDPWGTKTINSDCSGSVIQIAHYGKTKTGLPIQDPSKQNWSGYGNTDLYEDDWPTVTGSYQIGDLAHYQGHVTFCIKAGDWNSSDWWSFGSEPPSRRKLGYRTDFRKVVRPVYLS